jgi:soluble lytic murein transglycosylase-like protein
MIYKQGKWWKNVPFYLVIIAILTIVLLAICVPVAIEPPTPAAVIKTIEVQVRYSTKANEILADYVYTHSGRISKHTAKQIVDLAMQQKHPLFLLAIMNPESQYNPTATGSSGDIGLGQVVFKFHKEALIKSGIAKEPRDLYEIDANIRAMSLLFNDMLNRAKGDPVQALTFYNGRIRAAYQHEILVTYSTLCLLVEGV